MTHEKKINHLILYWLTTTLFLILLMITVGGLTRLTDSGLSITEWELFKGIFPPLDALTWEKYFNLYRDIPQYKLLYPSMSLDEFKIIFYWEYAHRLLGRIIGLFFLLPLIYFHLVRKISIKYLTDYYIILLLIIFQGFIGWYMVQSGLSNDVTVSHYRLSLHLLIAIIILSMIFWKILNIKQENIKFFFEFNKKNIPYLILITFLFLQIFFGALVSGLDAGKIYQTWPLMGNHFFPDDIEIKHIKDLIDFNSHSLVQFFHRAIAYLISIYILILTFNIFKKNDQKLYRPILIVLSILLIQVILGISTLISGLNIILASSHQFFSIILILTTINLYYTAIK